MTLRPSAFGSFVFDMERELLLRDGRPVSVSRRGVMLLKTLLAAEGRVVTKAALMDVAWPGQAVEESNLSVQLAALRKALGARPGGGDWIATVPRVGYQFRQVDDGVETKGVSASEGPERISLAVLPFLNLTSDREKDFFADGMSEDIIGALSRIPELSVVSRGASFTAKGRAMTAADVARDLGARYVLEGSVRLSGDRLRVTAQLSDSETGASVWAERYDGDAADLFAVQDDITRSIAQALQVALVTGDGGRIWEGQTSSLKAWEKAVLGYQAYMIGTAGDNSRARRLLEEAVALDPRFAGAMALIGLTHYWDARYIMAVNRAQALASAERCVEMMRAVDAGEGQLASLRSCIAFVKGDYAEAISLGALAVSRSPSDARISGIHGMFLLYEGRLQEVLAAYKDSLRHRPVSEAHYYYYPSIAHMWLGDFDKALDLALRSPWIGKGDPHSHAYLAAIHMLRGDRESARQAIAVITEGAPGFGLRNIRYSELYRERSYLERLLAALAAAGLKE